MAIFVSLNNNTMITVILDNNTVFIDSKADIIKTDVYDYKKSSLLSIIHFDREFTLSPGIYEIDVFYIINNEIKHMTEILCVSDICLFCQTRGADHSLREHVYIKTHKDCFYLNQHSTLTICQHDTRLHTLEHDDIEHPIESREIYRCFMKKSRDDTCCRFYDDSIYIVYSRNRLKIHQMNRLRTDANAIILIFANHLRFYEPRFETLQIKDISNFHMINMARDNHILSKILKSRFHALRIIARYHNTCCVLYIITTSNDISFDPRCFTIHSNTLIVL